MKFYLDGQCNVSPCSVQVDGVSYYYTSTDCFPFVIYDDRVYFGTPGGEHEDLEAHLGISRGLITHEGRFYMKPRVLEFWDEDRDITPENVRLVVGALKKRIGIKPNSIRLFMDCAYDVDREYDGDLIVEMTPEEYLSHNIAGKNTDYFWDLYKKKNKRSDEGGGTTQSGMSAKDVWRHYKYIDESKNPVRLNESDIREMVRRCVSLIREGADFNVRGVYHVSGEDFNEF